jgi:hypothetical protein
MRVLLLGAMLALLGAAACSSSGGGASAPPTPSPQPTVDAGDAGLAVAQQPTPVSDSCASTCAKLTLEGVPAELSPPFDDSAGDSAVTFGAGSWYVAWGGRPAIVTLLQRFTGQGDIDGVARSISGTTPLSLLWRTAGELLLLGWVPPAYTAAGSVESLHRFGPALEPIGAPLVMRAPGGLISQREFALGSDGALVSTRTIGRARPLLRELTLDPSAGTQQTPVLRDWFMPDTSSSFVAFSEVGGQRFAVDFDGSAIRVTPLAAGGTFGSSARVIEASFEPGNVVVWSKMIGGRWWVGGYSARYGATTVHLRAIDPATLTGLGEPIAISWPQGTPYELIDANGTPAILGHLGEAPIRANIVPIDVTARAVCRASAIVASALSDRNQTIRASHFEGNIGGLTLDTWGQGPRRMFFARVRCQPGG